ncbi:MAG: hypothetical protein Fur0015_08900 [Ignavibacteriales bacterium]
MNFLKYVALMFLAANFILAQNNYDKNKYQTVYDSLSTLKISLQKEIESLKIEIDTLKSISESNLSLLKECEYKMLVKKYGKEAANRLSAERIWKGMTEDMLKEIWGKPDKVTTKKEKWGTFTQYYYGKITFFFKNKKLIDWEEEK